jgi:hypothetical protein
VVLFIIRLTSPRPPAGQNLMALRSCMKVISTQLHNNEYFVESALRVLSVTERGTVDLVKGSRILRKKNMTWIITTLFMQSVLLLCTFPPRHGDMTIVDTSLA